MPPLPLRDFVRELERRRVFRVAGLYAVAAWAVVQVASTVFPILELPAWTVRLVLLLVALGFPVALALAWAFDLEALPDPAHPSPELAGLQGDTAGRRGATAAGIPVARGMLVALVAVLAGAGLWAAWARAAGHDTPSTSDAVAVAVFPFDVRAGHEAEYLREGMVSLLAARLDGAGGLRSADPQALLRSVPGDLPDVVAAARLASHFGAGLYVLGSVVGGGGRVEIAASLYRTGRGNEPIATASAEGAMDSVFGVVDRVAMQLLSARAQGGETGSARTAALTTGSLPAFKAYLEGERALRELRTGPAVEAFTRAVEIDTTFALAWSRLAISAIWHGDDSVAVAASAAAEHRSGRLPPRYREQLAADVAFIRDDPDVESRYRSILARYPQDAEMWYRLGELLFHRNAARGRSATEARAPFERALALDPGNELYLVHLRELACMENRIGDLPRLNPRGAALDSLNPLVNGTMVALAGPAADRDRAVRKLASASDEQFFGVVNKASVCAPPEALWALFRLAERRPGNGDSRFFLFNLDLARGRWVAAREKIASLKSTDPASETLVRARGLEVPLLPHDSAEFLRARVELLALDLAHPQPGSQLQPDSLRVLDELLRQYHLGRIALSLGRQQEAENHVTNLRRASSTSPFLRKFATLLAARLHAHALAASGRRLEALRALDDLDALRLVGEMAPGFITTINAGERWLRAELLRALGRDQEALGWYDTFTDDWGEYWFLAPAELRIAQLREKRGERREAARSYRRFVALWHDADPELQPLVHAAEARIRTLER